MHFCIKSMQVYFGQHASMGFKLAPLSCRDVPIWGVPVSLKGSSGSIIALHHQPPPRYCHHDLAASGLTHVQCRQDYRTATCLKQVPFCYKK